MSSTGDAVLYPLFLKVAGRRVVVVGAGAVAERKIEALLSAGAQVRVVASEATEGVRRLATQGAIEWRELPFAEHDLEGGWLVIAATDDPRTQQAVARACEARLLFVVAVDDPSNASAYSGAVVRRPPFTVAISSSGATPALTRLVREVIEEVLPGEDWVEHARRLRAQWKTDGTPMGERFGQLLRALRERADPSR